MVDITKCTNKDCLKKEKCYRYTAPSSGIYQSYCFFKSDENNVCEDFMPIYSKVKNQIKERR